MINVKPRLALIWLALFCSQAFADNCPPWRMCGKKGNQIRGDDDGYQKAIAETNAAIQAARVKISESSSGSGSNESPEFASVNVEQELQNNNTELTLASASSDKAEAKRKLLTVGRDRTGEAGSGETRE